MACPDPAVRELEIAPWEGRGCARSPLAAPARQLPWLGPAQRTPGRAEHPKKAAGSGLRVLGWQHGQRAAREGLRGVGTAGRTRSSSRLSSHGPRGGGREPSPGQASPARLTCPLAAEPVLDVVGLVGEELDEFVLVLLSDALALQQEPPADQPATGARPRAHPQPGSSPLPSSPRKGQAKRPQPPSAAGATTQNLRREEPGPARTANFRLEATSPSI